jgi:hypothetical protein
VRPTIAQSVIRNTLAAEGLEPSMIDGQRLHHFIERAMIGLRLFCDPQRLPELTHDLDALCQRYGATRKVAS